MPFRSFYMEKRKESKNLHAHVHARDKIQMPLWEIVLPDKYEGNFKNMQPFLSASKTREKNWCDED